MVRRKSKLKFPPLILTPEQQQFASDLGQAREEIQRAEQYLGALLKKCKHVVRPLTEEMKAAIRNDATASWDAGCELCEEGFGYYCPESPDSVCHYFTDDGTITLIDGSKVPVPNEDHDPEYETDDSCLFCGDPYERK